MEFFCNRKWPFRVSGALHQLKWQNVPIVTRIFPMTNKTRSGLKMRLHDYDRNYSSKSACVKTWRKRYTECKPRKGRSLSLCLSLSLSLHGIKFLHCLYMNRGLWFRGSNSSLGGDPALQVAEMYSRLFADQWLQAYEFMDNNLNQREDKVLDILQRILRVTIHFTLGHLFKQQPINHSC